MSELGYLRQRICEQLQVATARRDLGRRHLGQRMREVSDAAKQFNVEAASVVQEVIVPRMQLVVELLKNAELVALDAQRPFRVQTRFRHSEELMGPGVSELSIEGRADRYDRLTIHSSLRLNPESLHASSTRASWFGFPVKHQAVAAWIDAQILKCVERIAVWNGSMVIA